MKKFQNFESSTLSQKDLYPIYGGSSPANTLSHGNKTGSTGSDSDTTTTDADTDFY